MHFMQPTYPARRGGDKILMPQLWGNSYLALRQMPKIRETIPLPEVRVYRSLGVFSGPVTCVFGMRACLT
jgi:hypothetical protein